MLQLTGYFPWLEEKERSELKVSHMEIFRFDSEPIENCNPLGSALCICGLLKVFSCGVAGYAEYTIPDTRTNIDLVQWASVFIRLKGLSIAESIRYVQDKDEVWGPERKILVECALTDLISNLNNPMQQLERVSHSRERSLLFDRSQAYFAF
ncbi:hypothetical protein J2T13_003040 [Paenibacillus sp. DS2015]|uniref:hypothetical protein n=1 Tax=Paenibacillus sp. DS2015 TaxID=3373917 RepID=UPI003D197F6A